jgi:hypothetical protein
MDNNCQSLTNYNLICAAQHTTTRCRTAFEQYLKCSHMNKKSERCEKEFYDKCVWKSVVNSHAVLTIKPPP